MIPWLGARDRFPPVERALAERNTLLAAGADLSVPRLIEAYRNGIFPWYSDGQPTIAVDTHIFRVANRTGIAPGKDVLAVEQKLLKVVPEEFRLDAHHWLILRGRYVCKARKPERPRCQIRDLCEYRHKTVSGKR